MLSPICLSVSNKIVDHYMYFSFSDIYIDIADSPLLGVYSQNTVGKYTDF